MEFTLNGKNYEVIRFLGRGKGGYSYLVTDGAGQFTLKKIHHEPCDYYTFGDKLASELRDYERLWAVGIPMPALLAVDREQELILKEYIDGPSIYELVQADRMVPDYYHQVRAMCALLYPAGLNIDYFPTIKKLSQSGLLTMDSIFNLLREPKANQQDKISFRVDDLRRYFPKSYSAARIQETILKLLSDYQKKRNRDISR